MAETLSKFEIPSWCPQWNSFGNGDSRFDTGLEYTWYRAAKDSHFQFSELEDTGTIKVGGFVFDVIVEGFEYIEASGVLENPSPQLRMLDVYMYLLIHVENRPCKNVYKNILEAFASTCTAGSVGDNHGSNCLAYMNILRDKHVLSEDPSQSSGDPDEFDELTAETTRERRRIFITNKGYFGIGPKALVEGDICCILFGARVPYILRPLEDSTYLLVGECYVRDIMLGEAFDMYREEQKFAAHEFVFR